MAPRKRKVAKATRPVVKASVPAKKKPLRTFWVPPSTTAAESSVPTRRHVTPGRTAESYRGKHPMGTIVEPATVARKMWTPEQLGFSKRQEYGVDGVSWSSEEEIEIEPGFIVKALWYGRPITAVSVHDWKGHHATATLPGVVHPLGLADCRTCDWHNLGNPKNCPAALGVQKLLLERTSDRPPF